MMRRLLKPLATAGFLALLIALFGADPVSGQPFAAQIQALLRRSNTWLGTQTFTNVTVTGTCTGCGTFDGTLPAATTVITWPTRSLLSSPANAQLLLTNNAATAGVIFDTTTDTLLYFKTRGGGDEDIKARSLTTTAGSSLVLAGTATTYKNITTAGLGLATIYAQARTVAATNTGTASVASYANSAADGTFEVGCNVLVTTSTTHSFSCDVTYTDEGNTARTMVLPIQGLGGNFATNGLITNALGVGPYESAVMTIRVKASTTITVRTSAGGTFTGVVYNIDGTIKQVG